MILSHQKSFGVLTLCTALGEPRSSWYRSRKPQAEVSPPRQSPRRLTAAEERTVLDTLNFERFQDTAPGEAYAKLLDEGVYICSERTIYRVLSWHDQNRIRRQATPRIYKKPELLATAPNEVWSWDITKLNGPVKWTYFYLYKTLISLADMSSAGWSPYGNPPLLLKTLSPNPFSNKPLFPEPSPFMPTTAVR